MSIQPSEFAKLAVVIGMALLVAERNEGRRTRVGGVEVVGMLLIAGLPASLIMLQPDLGTLLVLSATSDCILPISRLSPTAFHFGQTARSTFSVSSVIPSALIYSMAF